MASGFRQKRTKMCIIVVLVGSWECTRLVADKREQTCVFLYFSIMVGDLSLTDVSKHVFPYTSRFGECGFCATCYLYVWHVVLDYTDLGYINTTMHPLSICSF